MTVRNFFGEARQEAKAQGIQIGEARGFLNALFSLVGDGALPLATAAAKANMTEEAFKARMLEHQSSRLS